MLDANWVVRIGDCDVDPTATVCHGAVIGKPFRPLIGAPSDTYTAKTVVGPGAYIGYYSIVGAGSVIGEGVIVDDFSMVECGARIHAGTLLIYRAQVCNEAVVAAGCVIGGFVAERVRVSQRSRIFGRIVHSHHNPHLNWDSPESEEKSATIGANVFIGFGSIVVGAIAIGAGSYVCAGAIVTRNVPDNSVVYGVNKVVPISAWKGRLAQSDFAKWLPSRRKEEDQCEDVIR